MKTKQVYTAAAAVAGALLAGAGVRPALAGTTVYSFETLYNNSGSIDASGTRPDDFHNNGFDTTITQSTIGVTDLAHSMSFGQGTLATFTGAQTELLPGPLYASNAYAVSLDLTVPGTGNFTGTFARMGVSEFGDNAMFMVTGYHNQSATAAEVNISLSPGTHHLTLPLIALGNPFTGTANVQFASLFGPDQNTQFTATSWQLFINKSADQTLQVYIDNVAVQNNQTSVWKTDNDGAWSSSSSWIGVPTVVPNGVDALAIFSSITSTGTRTVTVDSPQTVGGLDFNGSGTFILSGASALTFDVASGSGSILVHRGNHLISAPLILNDDVKMTVEDPVSVLSITGNMTATGRTITTAGAGIVAFKNVRAGGLNVSQGAARIIAGATPNSADSASVVNSLSISAGAIFDLTNNSMIIDYTGPVGTRVTDVRSHLRSGRLQSGSATATTRLGYGDNAGLAKTTFAGRSVDASSVLIKYTYAGDANLDGTIDGGDYGIIDNFIQVPGASGYGNGDFNFDGVIDGGDYGIIDNNIQAQGAPFPVSGSVNLAGVTTVPEPAACGFAIVAGGVAALTRRRRRRHRRCVVTSG